MNIRQYLTNWSLYVRGFRYLWTGQADDSNGWVEMTQGRIRYKPGWADAVVAILTLALFAVVVVISLLGMAGAI